MLYFYTYSSIGKLRPFLVLFVLICTTYYAAVYSKHKDFEFSNFISFIQSNASNEEIPIVGMPDVWFAAMERPFYPIHNERDFNKVNFEEFYFVETDYLSSRSRVYEQVKSNIYANYNFTLISEWQAYGDNKSVLCNCKANGKSKIALEYKPYPGWQHMMSKFMPAL
jgi:hypothetical protein